MLYKGQATGKSEAPALTWPAPAGEHGVSRFELPPGASCRDRRWQDGHYDGGEGRPPRDNDPVYVSGWCHGWCEAGQTTAEEAVAAYEAQQRERAAPPGTAS